MPMSIPTRFTHKPSSDDAVVHDGLVRLVLEIALPAILEMGSGPGLKLLQLLSSRAYLDSCFNTIGSKGSGSLLVPLIEDLCDDVSGDGKNAKRPRTLLNDGISAHKVVKTLGLWLGSVDREVEVMILEVLA